MDAFGNSFGWVATYGFYYGTTILALVSLPNPLAIVWLGIIIVGTLASRFNYGGNNNAE
tara:strand:+ start:1135 stop:1311 length:177 start_codon:yes stop_codon:yes gene_type:complete